MPFVGVQLTFRRAGMPFVGVQLAFRRAGMPFVGVQLTFRRAGMPFVGVQLAFRRAGMPFVGVQSPFLSSPTAIVMPQYEKNCRFSEKGGRRWASPLLLTDSKCNKSFLN